MATSITRISFPKTRSYIAVSADVPFNLGLPDGILEALNVQMVPFTSRDLQVKGKGYCTLNKVQALGSFGSRTLLDRLLELCAVYDGRVSAAAPATA